MVPWNIGFRFFFFCYSVFRGGIVGLLMCLVDFLQLLVVVVVVASGGGGGGRDNCVG
jgi:hypothetical protein